MEQPIFKEYTTKKGEILLYVGAPNLEKLEELSLGLGDMWHSSFEQGYKNAFHDIVHQAAVFFWYVSDFDGLDECVSWRLNHQLFAIRKSVWADLGGFDLEYKNKQLQGLDFGYNALRNQGAVPLYVNGLFAETQKVSIVISAKDRYVFYSKNYRKLQSLFMIYRRGIFNLKEWKAYIYSFRNFKKKTLVPAIPTRVLKKIEGKPTVSYIIPTMLRQDFTLQLINDLANQSYLPSQIVVVDATPVDKRDESLYDASKFPFEVIFKWQSSKGSCRARNEAIALCTGEYIVFGDDDVRLPPNFIENHIKFLQTYQANACNGLDIRADHEQQTLDDLYQKLENFKGDRWQAGATNNFSNANSCVKREYVDILGGNDINFDGGYGEDGDFGISLAKIGATVLFNPFSTNLHLKPPLGGYRFWGTQAKITGKKRKQQPWELDTPVGKIVPRPSPTVMYQLYKHFTPEEREEYKSKYFFLYLFKHESILGLPGRLWHLPKRLKQFKASQFYAKKLIALGKRTS